ncbi:hypothetical protein FKM82_019122 [Ascaphus truei]
MGVNWELLVVRPYLYLHLIQTSHVKREACSLRLCVCPSPLSRLQRQACREGILAHRVSISTQLQRVGSEFHITTCLSCAAK